MTENEAIKRIRAFGLHHAIGDLPYSALTVKAFKMAIKALEEIQQYRAIVEECREARERQTPKKPDMWGDGYDDNGNMIYDMWDCPNCSESYELDYHNYQYCPKCGQAIDRHEMSKFFRKGLKYERNN